MTSPAPGPPARVVIADDNADMRDYLARLLAGQYDVETVPDGHAALAAIAHKRPDLLISDVMMPGLDGFALLRALRANEETAAIPVMLLSARAGEEARIEALQAGTDDYVVKPFSARELLVRVASRVEIWRLRAQADAERRRWRALLHQAPAAIAVLRGPDHVFELVNPEYLHATGREAADLLGKPIREALPEIAGQGFIELLDRVYRTGEAASGSERLVRLRLGEEGLTDRYFNFVYQRSHNAAGEVEGIFVHAVDVTEQVEVRRRIEESEKRLSAIFNQASVGIAQTDLSGRVVLANQRYCELVGRSPEELAGYRTMDITHPDDRERTQELYDRAVRLDEAFEIEKRYVRPNGEIVWVHKSLTGVRDEQGRPRYFLNVVQDITARRQAEEAIRQKQKLESIGVLAGGVAHDFNNLLTGVLGNASLVLEMLPPSDPKTELLEEIVHASERAANLTRQMLAYAGKGSFVLHQLDISAHVREIGALVHAAIPKQVSVEMALAPDLPAIEADPGQVQQIVMNLVINAAEAIGEDRTGRVRVATRCEILSPATKAQFLPDRPPPGLHVVLEVEDDGAGMTEDIRAQIFDPFFSTKFTGRGLGLSAVLGIARSSGGAVTVESAPGHGSTFRVYFPALARASHARADQVRLSKRSGVVLMVDDESVVRSVAQQALERHGYTVLLAANGREAVDIFQENAARIDVVVLDLAMPVMGGEETLRALRRIQPDVRVIVSSGYEEREALSRFSGRRPSGFLQKPYSSARLIFLVGSLLKQSEASTG